MRYRAKDLLQDLDVRPSKGRGQNFVINTSVITQIIEFGFPSESEHLVEIGPGLGALTSELYKIGPLAVIEIEMKFCEDLERRFPNLVIVNKDVRLVDFSSLGKELVVFGNLPYSFSTEIIFHLIDNSASIARAVLLLQREFAERLVASPGGRDYGVLSVSCQIACETRLGPIIPGNSFHPPTKVESRLVELKFPKTPRFEINDVLWLKRCVRASFLQRRKKLLNSLRGSGFFINDGIEAACKDAGIDPGRRAETLSIEEFIKLSKALQSCRPSR